jgi:hypothetical protein
MGDEMQVKPGRVRRTTVAWTGVLIGVLALVLAFTDAMAGPCPTFKCGPGTMKENDGQ